MFSYNYSKDNHGRRRKTHGKGSVAKTPAVLLVPWSLTLVPFTSSGLWIIKYAWAERRTKKASSKYFDSTFPQSFSSDSQSFIVVQQHSSQPGFSRVSTTFLTNEMDFKRILISCLEISFQSSVDRWVDICWQTHWLTAWMSDFLLLRIRTVYYC